MQTIGGGVVLDPLPAAARGSTERRRDRRAGSLRSGWPARAAGVLGRRGARAGRLGGSARPARRDRRVGGAGGPLARGFGSAHSRLAPLSRSLPFRVRACGPGQSGRDPAPGAARRRRGSRRRLAKHAPAAAASRRGCPLGRGVETALAARGAVVITGEEVRAPGREDLAMPERELSERIAALFRERGLDPPAPAEVADALRRHPKVVDGLIGYLVKKGSLVRLPGGWIVAREAVDAVVARLREQDRPLARRRASSRRSSG